MVSIHDSTIRRRPELRDYQRNGDEQVRALLRAGKRRILIVASTGSGKGTWAADLVARAAAKGKRSIFLVNRREIVFDFSRRLDALGLNHGVIMADHPRRAPWLPVHVASIDTLRRRNPPPADILILDECHFSVSACWLDVLAKYPDAIVLGTTATPVRADGKGLGEIFECLVEWPPMLDLIDRGYLVPSRVYAPSSPDLAGVHTKRGDFDQKELAEVCDKPRLVGDIVEHWSRLASDRPTVVFAVDRNHARHIADEFIAAGYRFEYVDANTENRQEIWDRLSSGEIHGVSSVGIISYGWDCLAVSCAILARPTQSVALYLQQVGRVMRPAPGKPDCIVLDHAGNTLRHGFPDDPREWSLEGAKRRRGREEEESTGVRVCQQCWFTFRAQLAACPACGWVAPKQVKEVEVVAGELTELTRESVARALLDEIGNNAQFQELVALRRIAHERGYKRGYPAMQYRLKHGTWPPRGWMDAAALMADPADAPARQELLEGVA